MTESGPETPPGPLAGKSAVVTGGSRGIGRAVALRLAREGCAVLFSYRDDAAAAREVVAEIRAAGGRAEAERVDLGVLSDLDRLFAAAEAFGGADILVNNAAVSGASAIADITEAEYDRIMAVNAKAPLFALRWAGNHLRKGGRIVNVSSLNTAVPEPGAAAYSASKAALEQFTRVASREFADRGITVNTVSPGPVETDMLLAANPPEVLEQAAAMTPLGRLGRPADIADVVAFLAGPDARWITGQKLVVAGGLA
ncbi:SDR family oxidoreductase [Actinorugispora endophytica]|uniref:3-oxoacyl-[acyl-carrier protein] reductase n=1 Tax=Actinorugispora endophytica TaxID=1605990 RepID=A0A4R6VC30_9ACTN|nr:SDR family oxidoreductase [Actinorugispora endophytica]TDQ54296.1 3-oxoacyl-[acyl-carrier protein] reductase [Actinorugispora endophytica]